MKLPLLLIFFLTSLLVFCDHNKNEKESAHDPGLRIYNQYCRNCHGKEGSLGLSGASNLIESELSRESVYHIIARGKGNMQGFEKALTDEELELITAYAISLRNKP